MSINRSFKSYDRLPSLNSILDFFRDLQKLAEESQWLLGMEISRPQRRVLNDPSTQTERPIRKPAREHLEPGSAELVAVALTGLKENRLPASVSTEISRITTSTLEDSVLSLYVGGFCVEVADTNTRL